MPLSRRTALLLAAPILLTACSGGSPAPVAAPTGPPASPSPSPTPVDPRPRLALAAKDLAKTSYKIVETDGTYTNVWQVHGPSKSFQVTPSDDLGRTVQIGRDKWIPVVIAGGVSATVPGGKTRWIKAPKSAVAPMPDVVAARLITAATGLTESAGGTFTGSVPEKVCREVLLFAADVEGFVPLDPQAKPVKPVTWADTGTITIRLDAQGRFVGLAVDVPSADGTTAKKVSQNYSDFGRAKRPTRPPASQVLELSTFPN